jgi:hypothetical protein
MYDNISEYDVSIERAFGACLLRVKNRPAISSSPERLRTQLCEGLVPGVTDRELQKRPSQAPLLASCQTARGGGDVRNMCTPLLWPAIHVVSWLIDVRLGVTTKNLGSGPGLGNARHRKKLTAEVQGE